MKVICFIIIVIFSFLGFGCETTILRQDIPVSTNPMGAKIYVDGKFAGQTPGTVSPERTHDHILTLVKDNYRQEDVLIRKQYQPDKVFMKAIQSGINSGLFFKDTRMAINSGYSSISRQEETGEAYILVPPTVKINLVPLYAGVPGSSAVQGYPPAVVDSQLEPADTGITAKDMIKAGVVAGAAAGAAQTKPIEKKWETSSSSRSYTRSDGTVVTEKSSTSLGVSVNPVGLFNALDTLFK